MTGKKQAFLQVSTGRGCSLGADYRWITVLAPTYSLSIVERHVSNGLCDSLWQRDRRGAASFCYRNRAEITVLMRAEHKPYPVWFSCQRSSHPVL